MAEIIEARLLVNERVLDIVYLNGMTVGNLIRPPHPKANVFNFSNFAESETSADFDVKLIQTSEASVGESILVYAPVNILSIWHRFSEDAEALLANRRQFILILIQDQFTSLSVAAHSYILSILLSNFSKRKYDFNLDVYLASKRKQTLINCLKYMIQNKVADILRLIGLSGLKAPEGHNEPPESFSALVVSVNRKDQKL